MAIDFKLIEAAGEDSLNLCENGFDVKCPSLNGLPLQIGTMVFVKIYHKRRLATETIHWHPTRLLLEES
jgi:hypothetical protein